MTTYGAFARGIATVTSDGKILDTWYIDPVLQETTGGESYTHKLTPDDLNSSWENLLGYDAARDVERIAVETVIADLDTPPVDAYDAYLRLHLLSYRLVKPNTINLSTLYRVLQNVVWTNFGPCSVETFAATRLKLVQRGPVIVYGIDRFPRMVDYVIPSGVRISDADRVRLGAYLSEGTTVMHEGFVNFNAGTLGVSMVEGRISQGVIVGDGSDIGGGASIMGTLSGGGTQHITIGERCLLGANSGLGIPLGNDCVVEAGLYITACSKIMNYLDGDPTEVKALDLAGRDNVLFRRNSLTGVVEAVKYGKVGIELNDSLHNN